MGIDNMGKEQEQFKTIINERTGLVESYPVNEQGKKDFENYRDAENRKENEK